MKATDDARDAARYRFLRERVVEIVIRFDGGTVVRAASGPGRALKRPAMTPDTLDAITAYAAREAGRAGQGRA